MRPLRVANCPKGVTNVKKTAVEISKMIGFGPVAAAAQAGS
jgi:hypothetical protein